MPFDPAAHMVSRRDPSQLRPLPIGRSLHGKRVARDDSEHHGSKLMGLVLFALLAWSTTHVAAAAETPSEYQVKAVFLYNFAQFVDWPAAAFADERAPLVIGVLGEDPFGPDLDAAVRGEIVNNRPLLVRRYRDISQVEACNILFISSSEASHLEKILGALRGRTILTVGDSEDFARRGGMIRFVTDRNRIRLRISLNAVSVGNLTISSKLLRLADIVPAGAG
jgi:hypothetical protein